MLRWRHPERGLVSPEEFIPVAEETNLVIEIGSWVLKNACRQYRLWEQQNIAPAFIAINVSSRQFYQRNFTEQVQMTLASTRVSPECLDIEVTEDLLMDDVENVLSALNGLHKIGINLSIDDFGTGYSSLRYLKRFPFDTLKIDRSFINGLPADREAASIVRAIIVMAHTLKKTVIAEGGRDAGTIRFPARI